MDFGKLSRRGARGFSNVMSSSGVWEVRVRRNRPGPLKYPLTDTLWSVIVKGSWGVKVLH